VRRAQAATGPTGWMRRFGTPLGVRSLRGTAADVEIQVREARLTDMDRVIGLVERADSRFTQDLLRDAADVLRQMLYLPNASLIVALDGRLVVGVAALVLRPSIPAGGIVGAIDTLLVEPGTELDGVVEALLNELMRQSRNKGCVALEGDLPTDAHELGCWEALGFVESGSRLRASLTRVAAIAW
jgi:N-acetylglutamate synthase-like GNAT family acetyltransferase